MGGDRAPVCPDREAGDASVSGVVVDPQTDHTDAHGILIRDDSGRTIDILTGNGDVPEFEGLRRGDRVSLRYSTSIGLDTFTGECGPTHFYTENSGRISR